VESEIAYDNSLNCEKIKTYLNKFDPDWWPVLLGSFHEAETSAVDSLKALRDRIAHAQDDGTGFITVRGYYGHAKTFLSTVGDLILPALA
jgi:hypothetical protein